MGQHNKPIEVLDKIVSESVEKSFTEGERKNKNHWIKKEKEIYERFLILTVLEVIKTQREIPIYNGLKVGIEINKNFQTVNRARSRGHFKVNCYPNVVFDLYLINTEKEKFKVKAGKKLIEAMEPYFLTTDKYARMLYEKSFNKKEFYRTGRSAWE